MNKVYIIGVGAEGAASLSPRAMELMRQAGLLVGGERLLAMFPEAKAQTLAIKKDLRVIVKAIRDNINQKRIVVLASGDPNFFGIARYLIEQLGKDSIEIIPGISSMQLAFARIKESWEDAVFLSVHASPLEGILEFTKNNDKICLFTGGQNTPDAIARFLLDRGITDFKAFVCQDLGSEKEKTSEGSLEQLSRLKFSPLNVMILMRSGTLGARHAVPCGKDTGYRIEDIEERKQNSLHGFGVPDGEFHQLKFEKGLITKMEVRAVSMAKMGIREDSVVWDIGAGSGAISIEASFLARRGKIFAIEKEEERLNIIRRNTEKFHSGNIQVVKAYAPEGLESLPEPDSVFIGGSGGKMEEILDICCQRLKKGGRIVANIATLENLTLVIEKLEEKGLDTEIVYLSAARGKKIKDLHRLEGMNPVFIVSARKK